MPTRALVAELVRDHRQLLALNVRGESQQARLRRAPQRRDNEQLRLEVRLSSLLELARFAFALVGKKRVHIPHIRVVIGCVRLRYAIPGRVRPPLTLRHIVVALAMPDEVHLLAASRHRRIVCDLDGHDPATHCREHLWGDRAQRGHVLLHLALLVGLSHSYLKRAVVGGLTRCTELIIRCAPLPVTRRPCSSTPELRNRDVSFVFASYTHTPSFISSPSPLGRRVGSTEVAPPSARCPQPWGAERDPLG